MFLNFLPQNWRYHLYRYACWCRAGYVNDVLVGELEGRELFNIKMEIMYAEIVSIGDEILIGQIVNTNAVFIAKN